MRACSTSRRPPAPIGGTCRTYKCDCRTEQSQKFCKHFFPRVSFLLPDPRYIFHLGMVLLNYFLNNDSRTNYNKHHQHCRFWFAIIAGCHISVVTPITTRGVASRMPATCVASARVRRAGPVSQWTGSSARWCPGACPTRATGTTTGRGCTVGSTGRASSAPPSPTQNRWANRYVATPAAVIPPLWFNG